MLVILLAELVVEATYSNRLQLFFCFSLNLLIPLGSLINVYLSVERSQMKEGLFSAFLRLRFRRDRRVSEDEGELEAQLSETLAEVLGFFAELDELAAEELGQVAPVKNVPERFTVED